MSEAGETERPENTLLAEAKALVNSSISQLEVAIQAFNVQVLGNADVLPRNVKDAREAELYSAVIENLIKSPLRLQVRRLKSIQLALSNARRLITKEQ